jgi:hypothetical protein
MPAATLDADREEFEGYGLGRKLRTEKMAAKRRSVKLTSTVSLPILKCAGERGLKILRAISCSGKGDR